MDLRRLSYFIRISENGSLTRAAGVLRIAQPALSRQLRLLENELGVVLFNRTKRGMTLTQDGDFLYNSIVGPLRELDRALLGFRSFSSGIDGKLNFGIPAEMSALIAAPLLNGLKDSLPRIRPRIVQGPSGHLHDLLNRGIIDYAFLEGSWNQGILPTFEIHKDQLILVGPKVAGLDSSQTVHFREAANMPLIVPCQPFGIRNVLNEAALEYKKTLNVAFEIDSMMTSLQLTSQGQGYSIVPKTYLASLIGEGSYFSWAALSGVELSFFLSTRGSLADAKKGSGAIDKIVTQISKDIFGAAKKGKSRDS